MAQSRCQCGSATFEVVINSPRGSNFKLAFIQCAACGIVVGVQDYYNTGQKIDDAIEAINQLHLKGVRATATNIESAYTSLYNEIKRLNKRLDELDK